MSRLEMDAATLAQVSKLLDEALEREPTARAAWVESLDARFEDLKPRLRDLLSRAASVETGEFLRTIPKIGGEAPATGIPGLEAGGLIGPYRLLRELGAGGMGAVWLAERADGLIKRGVALKLPHLVTPRRAELAERMAREREILSTLDHRNIAKLLDAGVTPEGQPYLALEFVEGVPVDRYLRGAAPALPVDARLRLFLQVASAVAYAHGKLVLHRDLKPANILVGADGEVRLLDFGIAKLLDAGEARATMLTQFAGGALTPDYASPEQILGEPLTVASDVYSLGVVLYEMLTGARPYKLKRDSRGALEDAIVQAEPARASEAAPVEMRKAFRGDLDTILTKALKKNPAERYATVNAFVDDIARFLENRPVLAQPDTTAYRVRKFVLRHKLGVAAASLVLLAVVMGAGIATWQARRANVESVRAQTVRAVLTGMLESADPYSNEGASLSAAELLKRAVQAVEANPSGDPAVRAEIANVLARSLFRLNEDESSEALAERALADMSKSLPADDPQVARAHVLIAEQLRYRGKQADAQKHLDAAQPGLARLQDSSPADEVNALLIGADVAIEQSDYVRAAQLATRARDLSLQRLGREHELTVRALGAIAETHHQAERLDEALAAASEALTLAQVVFRDRPHAPMLNAQRGLYARTLGGVGRWAESADQLELALREDIAVHGPNSMEAGMRAQALGGIQVRAGRIQAAIDSMNRAAEIRLPQVAPVSLESVSTRYVQARALMAGRQMSNAYTILKGLEGDAHTLFGKDHPRAYEVSAALAVTRAWNGEIDAAAEASKQALSGASANGTVPEYLVMHWRAQVARLAGAPDEGATIETSLLNMKPAILPRADKAEVLTELATCALLKRDNATAHASLDKAFKLIADLGHDNTPLRAEAQIVLTQLALIESDEAQALTLATAADEFWRGFDADNRGAGEAAYWLARAEMMSGREQAARGNFERAARILRKSVLRADRELVRSL
jgi:serine/threonine-protein kinase